MKKVPNILSTIRILLVPVMVAVYFSGLQNARHLAALVFILAMFTDVLDGRIARKYDAISDLGRILDPVGDKLMTIAIVACLAIDKKLPMWALAFFFGKEMIMLVCGLVLHTRIRVEMPSSNHLGKAATAMLFTVSVLLLFLDIPQKTAAIMITCVMAVALAAFVSYALVFLRILSCDDSKNQRS